VTLSTFLIFGSCGRTTESASPRSAWESDAACVAPGCASAERGASGCCCGMVAVAMRSASVGTDGSGAAGCGAGASVAPCSLCTVDVVGVTACADDACGVRAQAL